jgi:hypothetical protein
MDAVKEFLTVGYGSGYGDGYGSGYGYGYGSGSGSGYGYGDSDGDGSGYGYGDGSGYGSGYGDSDGDGSGSGSGSGSGLKSINNMQVHLIDDVETIIKSIRNNIAKGFIVGSDWQLTPCVIVKSNNMFAHGKDLHKAMASLKEKLFDGMSTEERIEAFLKEFNLIDKYKADLFYDWHNKLTGSCEMGRRSFAKNHSIDLENDAFTVKEFVEITKNDYGSSVIKQLEQTIKQM